MFDLTGMTALVTGASGGIGSAIAAALAGQGARVALSGTREEALRSVADGMEGAVILPCNLSDAAAVDALVPQAVEALGKLDILINNAGVTRDNLVMRRSRGPARSRSTTPTPRPSRGCPSRPGRPSSSSTGSTV